MSLWILCLPVSLLILASQGLHRNNKSHVHLISFSTGIACKKYVVSFSFSSPTYFVPRVRVEWLLRCVTYDSRLRRLEWITLHSSRRDNQNQTVGLSGPVSKPNYYLITQAVQIFTLVFRQLSNSINNLWDMATSVVQRLEYSVCSWSLLYVIKSWHHPGALDVCTLKAACIST